MNQGEMDWRLPAKKYFWSKLMWWCHLSPFPHRHKRAYCNVSLFTWPLVSKLFPHQKDLLVSVNTHASKIWRSLHCLGVTRSCLYVCLSVCLSVNQYTIHSVGLGSTIENANIQSNRQTQSLWKSSKLNLPTSFKKEMTNALALMLQNIVSTDTSSNQSRANV